jgi:hypothetical protein
MVARRLANAGSLCIDGHSPRGFFPWINKKANAMQVASPHCPQLSGFPAKPALKDSHRKTTGQLA